MARKTSETVPEIDEAAYMTLLEKLQSASTSSELWKVGGTDEFKAGVAALGDAAQGALRDTFQAFDAELKGKVKTEDIAGQVVIVSKWEFPPASPRYPNSKFVVLYGTREDGEKFELVSGASQVVRFFERLDVLKDSPQRIRITQESPEAMVERKAKPDTSPMWLVERLGMPVARRNANASPF